MSEQLELMTSPSTINKVEQTLASLFLKYRIIFWYDDNREMRESYEAINIPEIINLEIDNNEFSLKHRVIKLEPNQKFLIYSAHSKPEDGENWLLDLNLAFHEFSADRSSLILHDLNLPIEKKTFVGKHKNFFQSTSRIQKLR